MKAMIWAAGLGKRMQPLTLKTPKPLLKVGNQALIEYHLQALAKAGVTDVVINVHHLADQIMQFVGDGKKYHLNIDYSIEDELLETGGGTLKALPLLGDKPFIAVSSDIYSDFDFSSLPKILSGQAHLVLTPNPDYHPQGDYALDDNGLITLQGEKLNYSGYAVLDPSLFQTVSQHKFPISDLFATAIQQQKVTGQLYSGSWFNIGTPHELASANKGGAIHGA